MPRVIVTGASSGLGAALAHAYAKRGAALGLIARRRTELEALAATLGRCRIYPADVRDNAALSQAAEEFIAHAGCPDIVVANAGVSYGTLTEHADDLAAIQDILDVNVMGVAHTFQPFIEPMRAAGKGVLVGIASVAGYRGLPGAEGYCASKAALIVYLESLRIRLRKDGIRVVTICPGYIATPMTAENPYPMPFLLSADAAAEKIARLIERGRSYAVIPWQMAIIARLMRVIPNTLFDRTLADAPHKPRR
jgi:short-subunit dehydrogenase